MKKQWLIMYFIFFITACTVNKKTPPSDSIMTDYLSKQRKELTYIINNLHHYPGISRIALNDGKFATHPHGVLPLLHHEFIATIQKIELPLLQILWRDNQWQYAEFVIFTSGMVFGGESKSLIYSKTPITEDLYQNLDKARADAIAQYSNQSTSRTFKGYKSLGEGWYIYQYIYF